MQTTSTLAGTEYIMSKDSVMILGLECVQQTVWSHLILLHKDIGVSKTITMRNQFFLKNTRVLYSKTYPTIFLQKEIVILVKNHRNVC